MTKHETIDKWEVMHYLNSLHDECCREFEALEQRLRSGNASKEEVQAFMKWRKTCTKDL